MTATTLCFGQRVIWQGQAAEIVDICYRADPERTTVQIRIRRPGAAWMRWVRLSELVRAE